MKIYYTATLTAMWRHMANVDQYAIEHVEFPLNLFGYILGLLDPNSVETIAQRTKIIDSLIKEIKPECIIEIGAGYSSRVKRFEDIKCYELDLPYFKKKKSNLIPFDICKDSLNLDIKSGLFIVEGVTMYLQEHQVLNLLKQIRKYKGYLIIDFFNREFSTKEKNLREQIYKLLFKIIVNRDHLFDFRIENINHSISLLKGLGYKNVKYMPYNVVKTLDALFYAKL